jgi:hypothetical protein
MMPGPPALVRIATRPPRGTGWLARIIATSNSSSIVSVRITPAWAISASTATSLPASEPVCELAARAPAPVRPLFTATIGLSRATSRRDRKKRARVAEALEVQEDHLDRGSSPQYCDQIVARDVGLVADRHELVDADAELLGVVEDGQADRARLRRERDAAVGRPGRREGGVEGDRGIGVEQAEAVGAHHAHAGGAHLGQERVLDRLAVDAGLGEAGGDDQERLHADRDAVVDDRRHARRRHHDHREVDRVGDRGTDRVRLDALHRAGARVDRVHRAGEAVDDQVVEDLRADRAAGARRADHRDGPGLEQRRCSRSVACSSDVEAVARRRR